MDKKQELKDKESDIDKDFKDILSSMKRAGESREKAEAFVKVAIIKLSQPKVKYIEYKIALLQDKLIRAWDIFNTAEAQLLDHVDTIYNDDKVKH